MFSKDNRKNSTFTRPLSVLLTGKQIQTIFTMKRFLLPHSERGNPEHWLGIKQRIEAVLSGRENLEDLVVEMLRQNGVAEEVNKSSHYLGCILI